MHGVYLELRLILTRKTNAMFISVAFHSYLVVAPHIAILPFIFSPALDLASIQH